MLDSLDGLFALTFVSEIDFSSVTVLFADIVGFTRYCSQREPKQVFLLLETLFREFDFLAKRYGTCTTVVNC